MSIEQISEVLSQQLEVLVKEYGAISVRGDEKTVEVQLFSESDDLNRIPGETSYEYRECDEYPWQAVKHVGKTKFFKLVSAEEAANLGLKV